MQKQAPTMTRRLSIASLLFVALIAAGCSKVTGTKSTKSAGPDACAFVKKLDDIANGVARADVHDPAGFTSTLDTAVHDYAENVRGLRKVAPVDLHASLDRVLADVQQFRFDAAVTDRARLDAYAQRTCGRVVTGATTTTAPGASTSSSTPGPTTTTTSLSQG